MARHFIILMPTKEWKIKTSDLVTFQIANNKSADQTAQMGRLVCAFVICKQQSQCFWCQGLYDVEAQASRPPPGYAIVP